MGKDFEIVRTILSKFAGELSAESTCFTHTIEYIQLYIVYRMAFAQNT